VVDKDPRRIRAMFASIAGRYDRANRLLSMRQDVGWRRVVAGRILSRPGLVLDLASGTGDLTVDLARHAGHRVVAADFTYEMLAVGRGKVARAAGAGRQATADALTLPFGDSAFDAVTVAFGIRNFVDPLAALREMHRVVRKGGAAGILEFSSPRGLVNVVYSWYLSRILPAIGGLVTGERAPYEYLPASVGEFPQGAAFLALLERAGFRSVTAERMSGGIVTFYRGEKE
jgi:demethylmenaquinone methyltransferase / 2-methoxy-6-polyprenyl-1,4-benzoquinol methylase